MKNHLQELFSYHHVTNQKIINHLLLNESNVSERTMELLSHSINAHQIWNARINDHEQLGVFDVHPIDECLKMDLSNYKVTLEIIQFNDLETMINYKNTKGVTYNHSIADILLHISNHFSHHRGQIMTDMKYSGFDTFPTDYIFFKRN